LTLPCGGVMIREKEREGRGKAREEARHDYTKTKEVQRMLLADKVKQSEKAKQVNDSFYREKVEAEHAVKNLKKVRREKRKAGKVTQNKAGHSKAQAIQRLSNNHYLEYCKRKASNHIRRFHLANTGKEPLQANIEDAVHETILYIWEKIQNDSYIEQYPVDVQIASKSKFAYINAYKSRKKEDSIDNELKSKTNDYFEVYQADEIEYSETLEGAMKRHTNSQSISNWQNEYKLLNNLKEYVIPSRVFEFDYIILANIAFNVTYDEIAELLNSLDYMVEFNESFVKGRVSTLRKNYKEKQAIRQSFFNLKRTYSNDDRAKLMYIRRIKERDYDRPVARKEREYSMDINMFPSQLKKARLEQF